MQVSLCIPTLNRYDLMESLIRSAQEGSVKPDHIYIIDNGGKWAKVRYTETTDPCGIRMHIYRPDANLGVAASWNWFLKYVPEMRIISNDDIVFEANTVKAFVDRVDDTGAWCPESIIGGNAYSCFVLPDKIVSEVGYFDEQISPGWAYLEDNDYQRRMVLAGYTIRPVSGCRVLHAGSSTIKVLGVKEKEEHNTRFRAAEAKYREKWGGAPGRETFTKPYNK